jgi:hypothetical protein
MLGTQGWAAVSNRFRPPSTETKRQPSLDNPNTSIPVHVNGNHWVALSRRKVNGAVYFLYADDLNSKRTEEKVKAVLYGIGVDPVFCPSNSIWINCRNCTCWPHSNECGPRTILALAVMMQHPSPHCNILLHYMEPNLEQCSRLWSATVLLTGEVHLHEPSSLAHYNQVPQGHIIPAAPYDLI